MTVDRRQTDGQNIVPQLSTTQYGRLKTNYISEIQDPHEQITLQMLQDTAVSPNAINPGLISNKTY